MWVMGREPRTGGCCPTYFPEEPFVEVDKEALEV
jgi:hypothetical protein